MPPFRYTPNQNQYVGSIADLMGRGNEAEAQALITSANAQAQAAQASGQAWGGAVQGIGNTIAAIPGQMQAQQDRELALAEHAEDRANLMGERERSNQAISDADQASAIYANRVSGVSDSAAGIIPKMSWSKSPERVEGPPIGGVEPLQSRQLSPDQHPYQVEQDGGWVFDIEGFRRAAAEAGPGVLEKIEPYVAQMESMNTMRRSVVELGRAEARNQATWLTTLLDEGLLQALPAAILGFKGVVDQGLLDSLTGLVEQGDVAGIRSVLNGYIGKPSQHVAVGAGETLYNLSTLPPNAVVEGPPVPPKPLGEPVEVVLNGQRALVQRFDDGKYKDLTLQGILPPVDAVGVDFPKTQTALIIAAATEGDPHQAMAQNTLAYQAEMDALAPLSSKERFDAEESLSTKFRSIMAPHLEIERQFQIMNGALAKITPLELLKINLSDNEPEFGSDNLMTEGSYKHKGANAASQAILVTFQKILDPDSVVRESEYARSAQGLGMLAQIRGAYMKMVQGGAGVPVDQLEEFVQLASEWVDLSRISAERSMNSTRDHASNYGLDAGFVTSAFNDDWKTPVSMHGYERRGAPPPANTRSRDR